jgi:hypothetical protein
MTEDDKFRIELHRSDVYYGDPLAADRIEDLIAENKRLGHQCEGLMQAGMNNGQALIIAEAKLAKAVEALNIAKQFLGHTWVEQHVNATLDELEGK